MHKEISFMNEKKNVEILIKLYTQGMGISLAITLQLCFVPLLFVKYL